MSIFTRLNFYLLSTNIGQEIIVHLKRDEKLKQIINICTLDIHKVPINVFDDLMRSIISQQLSTSAAKTIYSRFLKLLNETEPFAKQILNLSLDELRSVGLSIQKANYIKNVAEHFDQNQLHDIDWNTLSDDEIISELTKIKGVGRWTVEMILIFSLHRPDVLPLDDLVVRNNMMQLYNVTGSKKEVYSKLTEIAEAWRPFRSYASRYLWASKDTKVFKT